MKRLIGLTIRKVTISNDKKAITFVTDAKKVTYRAWGDCCSQSWFEEIFNEPALINATVVDSKEIVYPQTLPREFPGDSGRDVMTNYCWKIITNKGICDIVYRNESNGYYGGGVNFESETEFSYSVSKGGLLDVFGGCEGCNDLVKIPEKIEGWVVFYKDGSVSNLLTAELKDKYILNKSYQHQLACIKVSFTEGEGLDD